ncbi:MAG: hypothetical protein H0V43_13510 [Gemmatimonadales bacterium]|nr:hypothetical protein [Gemmatimonadales bacterium]MBA3553323.1 hypothetical protein [Gemmatimonadales bacterium]
MFRVLSLAVPALVLLTASALFAQDERWQVTLDGQEYVWDIRLVRLEGDSLVVRQSDTLRRLPVEEVTEIRLIRKSESQLGDGATGGAMNALTGGDDEIYDLAPLEFAQRLRAVQKILLMHPIASDSSP